MDLPLFACLKRYIDERLVSNAGGSSGDSAISVNLDDCGWDIDKLLAGGEPWPTAMTDALDKAAESKSEVVLSGNNTVNGVSVPLRFRLSSVSENPMQGTTIWMGLCGIMEPCVFLITYSTSQKMGMCMMDGFVMASTQTT